MAAQILDIVHKLRHRQEEAAAAQPEQHETTEMEHQQTEQPLDFSATKRSKLDQLSAIMSLPPVPTATNLPSQNLPPSMVPPQGALPFPHMHFPSPLSLMFMNQFQQHQLQQQLHQQQQQLREQNAEENPVEAATVTTTTKTTTANRSVKRESDHFLSDGNSDRSRSTSPDEGEAKQQQQQQQQKQEQEQKQKVIKEEDPEEIDPSVTPPPNPAEESLSKFPIFPGGEANHMMRLKESSQTNPLMTLANNAVALREMRERQPSPPTVTSPSNSATPPPSASSAQTTPNINGAMNDPKALIELSRVTEDSNARFAEYRDSVLSHMDISAKHKVRRNSKETASPATPTPMEVKDGKDAAYWERRRKNNEAAKRSRDARRAKENEVAIRCQYLEQECLRLRVELAKYRAVNGNPISM